MTDHVPPLTPPAPKPRALRRVLIEAVQTAIQAALLYFAISALFGRFEIRQTSMEPNFHEGQRVVVSQLGSLLTPWWTKTAYASDGQHAPPFGPERGQVVVLYTSLDHTDEPLIKRVIAGPGDTIEIANDVVKVNGAPIADAYVHDLPTPCYAICGPLTLSADEYFVMGDNRPNSRDSRNFGPVRGEQIIGRVILRYWPLAEFEFYP